MHQISTRMDVMNNFIPYQLRGCVAHEQRECLCGQTLASAASLRHHDLYFSSIWVIVVVPVQIHVASHRCRRGKSWGETKVTSTQRHSSGSLLTSAVGACALCIGVISV